MNAPLGVLFVTMGANHEQISFSYPFSSNYIMTFDKGFHLLKFCFFRENNLNISINIFIYAIYL